MEKILRSLDLKFNLVFVATDQSQNLESMIVDELQGTLLAYEDRLKIKNPLVQAFQAKVSLKDEDQEHGRGRVLVMEEEVAMEILVVVLALVVAMVEENAVTTPTMKIQNNNKKIKRMWKIQL